MKRLLPAALALCAVALPTAPRAQAPAPSDDAMVELDRGSFLIYQSGRLLGTEVFALVSSGDSLIVTSRSFQVLNSTDTLRKDVAQVVGLLDFGLRNYRSKQTFGRHTLTRGLELSDTAFTSFRQVGLQGVGERFALPPGRVFVVDPKVFICFDLICRSLQGKVFERRPLTLFVLGPRDSVVEATATDLGGETIRWGERPIQARKMSIGDAQTTFVAWAAPRGNLLRLEESTSGLRVERSPPPVKRSAPKPKPGG
jgi:hypothetical protein